MISTDKGQMPISGRDELARKICEILGINSKMCKEFTLVFKPNDVVVCNATIYPTREEMAKIVKELEGSSKGVLVEIDTIGNDWKELKKLLPDAPVIREVQ